MIKIFENGNIRASFFMKGDEVEISNEIPHIRPSQVHGKNILVINDENILTNSLPNKIEADGVLLLAENSQASLRFADCAPVLIWSEKKNFGAVLHSGFKGTVLKISSEAVSLMTGIYGHEIIKDLRAWIGPCIGREFYCRNISGDEWTEKGLRTFNQKNCYEKNGKIFFDLSNEIKNQLLECGLAENKIAISGIDTFKDSRCFSYRRGDKTERMTLLLTKNLRV